MEGRLLASSIVGVGRLDIDCHLDFTVMFTVYKWESQMKRNCGNISR